MIIEKMSVRKAAWTNLAAERRPGLYRILNQKTGSFYVGSTRNLLCRLRQHLNSLFHGSHFCAHLQSSWNAHGPEAFQFEVLAYCAETEILAKEQELLDRYHAQGLLFNSAKFAAVSSEDGRAKLAAKLSGRNLRLGIRHPNYGRKMSEDHRRVLSALAKGRTVGQETRLKMSAAKIGVKKSEETRRRMSAAQAKACLGRKASAKTKAKMSSSAELRWDIKRGQQRGFASVDTLLAVLRRSSLAGVQLSASLR